MGEELYGNGRFSYRTQSTYYIFLKIFLSSKILSQKTKDAAYALGAAENVFNSLLKPVLTSSENNHASLSSSKLDIDEKIKEIEV